MTSWCASSHGHLSNINKPVEVMVSLYHCPGLSFSGKLPLTRYLAISMSRRTKLSYRFIGHICQFKLFYLFVRSQTGVECFRQTVRTPIEFKHYYSSDQNSLLKPTDGEYIKPKNFSSHSYDKYSLMITSIITTVWEAKFNTATVESGCDLIPFWSFKRSKFLNPRNLWN